MADASTFLLKMDKNLLRIVQNSDEAIFIKDLSGKIVFANRAGERLTGTAVHQLTGKPEDAVFGYTQTTSQQMDEFVISQNRSLSATAVCKTCHPPQTVQISKHPYPNMNGRMMGIVCIVRPQTAVKENKKTAPLQPNRTNQNNNQHTTQAAPPAAQVNTTALALNRQLLGLQAATAAIAASLDLDHVIDTFSWELCELLDADECLIFDWHEQKQTLSHMGHYRRIDIDPDNAIVAQLNQFLVTKQVLQERRPYQLTLNKVSSRMPEKQYMQQNKLNVLLFMPMTFQDKITGLVMVGKQTNATPFTDQQISLALMLVNQASSSLANAQLYKQLTKVNEELRTSNEELDAFAHSVAHDLKNPLGIIVGFSEILLRDYSANLPEEMQEMVHFIVNNTRKMHAIIDSLLTLASVRKEEVSSQPVDMLPIVLEAKIRLNNILEESEAKIVMPENFPMVWGHAPWLEEVWVNYISNAVKYGGRPPHITIGFEELDDVMVRFWVQDNGRGLSAEQQRKLFVPFTRLNQASVKGHGLGLSIVKRIIEKLGGEVGIESNLGEGSKFTFTLKKLQSGGTER
ncbi:MAG: hypothetical protein Kow0080_05700 [Candidatus Promineifilaceae bacterium]